MDDEKLKALECGDYSFIEQHEAYYYINIRLLMWIAFAQRIELLKKTLPDEVVNYAE